jgi:hypothetical protein
MTKKSNETKDIASSDTLDTLVDALGIQNDNPKRALFTLYKALGFNVRQSALLSGYGVTERGEVSGGLYRDMESGKSLAKDVEQISNKIIESYRQINKAHFLPMLAQAEREALRLCIKEPAKLLRYPGLARQVKQVAGLLDDVEKPMQISIGNLQAFMGQVYNQFPGSGRAPDSDTPVIPDGQALKIAGNFESAQDTQSTVPASVALEGCGSMAWLDSLGDEGAGVGW